MKKTFYNIGVMNIWKVIDDLQAIGLTVTAMTSNSITVMATNGLGMEDINQIMENRGFF